MMTLSIHLQDSLQSYLLWVQERGLELPIFLADKEQNNEPSTQQQKDLSPESKSVLRTFGHAEAPLIVFLDAIEGHPPVCGEEKKLLLNLLRALGFTPGKDVMFCSLDTGPSLEPLTDRNSYREQVQTLIRQHKPSGLLMLGPVPYMLLSDQADYYDQLNQFVRLFSNSDLETLLSWHPSDFIRNPQLRKTAWANLQILGDIIHSSVKAQGT